MKFVNVFDPVITAPVPLNTAFANVWLPPMVLFSPANVTVLPFALSPPVALLFVQSPYTVILLASVSVFPLSMTTSYSHEVGSSGFAIESVPSPVISRVPKGADVVPDSKTFAVRLAVWIVPEFVIFVVFEILLAVKVPPSLTTREEYPEKLRDDTPLASSMPFIVKLFLSVLVELSVNSDVMLRVFPELTTRFVPL